MYGIRVSICPYEYLYLLFCILMPLLLPQDGGTRQGGLSTLRIRALQEQLAEFLLKQCFIYDKFETLEVAIL
jgi:hypothetical protein